MELEEFFNQNPKVAIGFSGGVDSAYLLYAAKKYGADVQPYYIKTAFQPQFEYADAITFCDNLNINLKVIEYDILSENAITSNPKNRCYFCKKALFSTLKQHANSDGYSVIIDGTNASDDLSDRPGAKAIEELSVLSPLKECGLTKSEIRELSKAANLFTWDKPAYACLATRTQSKRPITADLLNKIEFSENELASIGFSDFRVRVYNEAARLQIKSEQFSMAVKNKAEILKRLKPYFEIILLDLETR